MPRHFNAALETRFRPAIRNVETSLLTRLTFAERREEEIRGNADAEATRIYGRAFGADPEFYAFFRTLESYRALGANSTLMLRADSDFFRYLERTAAQ